MLIVGGLAVFAVVNFATALAPSFGTLMALRVLAALTLPRMPRTPVAGVAERLLLLRRPSLLLCVLGTMLAACGGLMPYIYMASVTHDLTGVGGRYVGVFVAIVGVSGAVGTVLGGRLTDRWGVDRTLLAAFGGVAAAALALLVVGGIGQETAPVWLVCLVLVLWGVPGWANNPPMNARAMQMGGDAATEAVALNTSGLYAGIALAGTVGGGAVNTSGGVGVLVVACVAGLITIVVMALSVRRYPSSRHASVAGPTPEKAVTSRPHRAPLVPARRRPRPASARHGRRSSRQPVAAGPGGRWTVMIRWQVASPVPR